MKRTLLVMIVIALLGAAATAQDLKPFNLYLGAGVSMPNGDFSNQYKLGLHAVAGIGFKMAPGFSVMPKAEFHTFSFDQDKLVVIGDATNIDGGNLNGLLAGADLRFAPPLPAAPVKPYLFGGGGLAHLSASDLTYDVGGETITQQYESANKFFWNIGAGFEFGGSPVLGFFVQARYMSISTDNVKSNAIPITVGIRF